MVILRWADRDISGGIGRAESYGSMARAVVIVTKVM